MGACGCCVGWGIEFLRGNKRVVKNKKMKNGVSDIRLFGRTEQKN